MKREHTLRLLKVLKVPDAVLTEKEPHIEKGNKMTQSQLSYLHSKVFSVAIKDHDCT